MARTPQTSAGTARLALDRDQVLAHRRRVGSLDARIPAGPDSLRLVAWAGLQDSMPRAALLSIHARMLGTRPDTWTDPSLVQVWGPRFSAFVVADCDRAVFTLGRLPDDAARRRRAIELADRLEAFLGGRRMAYGPAGHAMGIQPNALRYAAPTGRVLMHWDGARQPTIWTVPAPSVDPREARVELARRYLRLFGPGTAESFAGWAGLRPPGARAAFTELTPSLVGVRTSIGEGWILEDDEPSFRASPTPVEGVRLLPSGDAYFLLQGRDRELLVPDARDRGRLWTSRVWPGAVLVDGEIAATWRRARGTVTIEPWHSLSSDAQAAVVVEAESLPLPPGDGPISVRWAAAP